MNILKKHFYHFLFILMILGGVFGILDIVFAQEIVDNLGDAGEASGLGQADLRLVIARLIRTSLTVIGILTVILVIYAGFLWMTAAGNPEKVDKAKRILLNAGIGLVIIFSSIAITTFVINAITNATGAQNTGIGSRVPPIGGTSTINMDIAGNIDTDSVTVRINPAHCYNDVFDDSLGETGLDCGGACGACSGGACTETSDCAEGICVDNFCIATPIITNISPHGGASGTFVFIQGEFFGASEGTVYFTGIEGSRIEASSPSCSERWSNAGVTVMVPENAIDGPITVQTSGGLTDATNDEYGPLIQDFDVNDIQRPNLCRVSPNTARSRARVSLIGEGFGGVKNEDSHVYFDLDDDFLFDESEPNTYESWGNDSITVTTPVLEDGDYFAVVTVDGIRSNAVPYYARNASEEGVFEDLPQIQDIDPGNGSPGTYVTIHGQHFGSQTGTVRFENTRTGDSGIGSIDFPEACQDGFWRDDQVIIIAPDAYDNGISVTADEHNINLIPLRQDGALSNSESFSVTLGQPDPGICALSPNIGESGDEITVYGDHFGSEEGIVTFFDEIDATILSWADEEVLVTAPPGRTGPVFLEIQSQRSNTVNFEFGSVDDGEIDGEIESGYGWTFSTGEILETPSIVVACDANTISAVPNERFTPETCENIVIGADFTTHMDHSSLRMGETILVQRCLNDRCARLSDPAEGILSSFDTSDYTYFEVRPLEGLQVNPDTRYRVTVTAGARSSEGVNMQEDISWEFVTGPAGSVCEIQDVIVKPGEETLRFEGAESEYRSYATNGACLLLSNDVDWDWRLNESIASIQPGQCSGDARDECALVTARAEGQTTVIASDRVTGLDGRARLSVIFSDPYIEQYWPACNSACLNAEIGGQFNVPMRISYLGTGIEDAQNFIVEECSNELCTNTTGRISDSAYCTEFAETADGELGCIEFAANLDTNQLTEGIFYKATVSRDLLSREAKPLTRLNDPDGYSWIFGAGSDFCSISYVDVGPSHMEVDRVGSRTSFNVRPFSEPDSCSVAGQRLSATAYDWEWENPIINDPALHTSGDPTISEWVTISGELFESDAQHVPNGCTNSCLPTGSTTRFATCGNGIIETGEGEECEDGNILSGDGCSASCLREGIFEASPELCGNGVWNVLPNGAGEDCDDGNNQNGDGCSAQCLNEGSSAIGVVCGNGDIAFDPAAGGEDCDDGNSRSGDGCSASCTSEGSISSLESPAICGDRAITRPYETCDDSNLIDGDGCSSRCIREGFTIGSTCGDGLVAQDFAGGGEDCDDGNNQNGDGCSATCLFEGASFAYETPSQCGDGVVGAGEYAQCEVGVSGDGRIDPIQMAEISMNAVLAVDPVTQRAQSLIHVRPVGEFVEPAEATYALSCGATTDLDCDESNIYGVATNGCCAMRPSIIDVQPARDEGLACRNAAIRFTSDQELSKQTFDKNVFVILDTSTTGNNCPDSHKILTDSDVESDRSLFARLWREVKDFFIPNLRAQNEGACTLPIKNIQSVPLEGQEGQYLHMIEYDVLMEENASYDIVIEGDSDTADLYGEGIASRIGVHLNGEVHQSFTTSDTICELDVLTVHDGTGLAPGFFGTFDESHLFYGRTYSLEDCIQTEIQSIPGIYSWTWDDWRETSEGTIISDVRTGEDIDGSILDRSFATVVSGRESGSAAVIAQVTIDGTNTEIQLLSGYLPVTTFVCKNPWPTFEHFPFIDDETGTEIGTGEGSGWQNFTTHFCRDNGTDGPSEDLPTVHVVAPTESGPESIIKEYIFKVADNSGDAIGIRIAKNPDYLTPAAWYRSQGFTGSPSETIVDGYRAVQDGRTLYISAPNAQETNFVRDNLYSNIYIVSYNELATPETVDIFNQIIENLSFNTNIEEISFCRESNGVWTGETCSSDFDCDTGQVCADEKSKLRRDTARVTDMVSIASSLELYGSQNGVCNATTSQVCTSNNQCPSGEVCIPSVPTLQSGTFVRSFAASSWESWNTELGTQLGGIPSDPLNGYGSLCPEGQNSDTCVDELSGKYICPVGGYAYHYRSLGTFDYQLTAELESDKGNWKNPLPVFEAGEIEITGNSRGNIDGFRRNSLTCTGAAFGTSDICGDGVIGPNEVCELGQLGPAVSCAANGIVDSGTVSQVCNDSCSGFEISDTTACIASTCGNGVIDAQLGEQCDDGVDNGSYGFCGSDCTYTASLYCGDGTVSSGESCDCGSTSVNGLTISGGMCTGSNGSYQTNAGQGCAWDCSGNGPFCGDNIVQSAEQCDGTIDLWEGALCGDGTQCVSDADCEQGSCGGLGGNYDACGRSRVCVAGEATKVGFSCSVDSNCDSPGLTDGLCSSESIQLTRTRTCHAASSGSQDACTWQNDWPSISCRATLECGNGILEDGEQCDDGNSDNTDGCTNRCEANTCGDGFVYAGVEQCDNGDQNGVQCQANYGQSCTYCSGSCGFLSASGDFCGDGVRQSAEYCDGSDLQNILVSKTLIDGNVATSGFCPINSPIDYDGDNLCIDAGVCNGGTENGEVCFLDEGQEGEINRNFGIEIFRSCSEGGGNCIAPSCSGTCLATCPFDYEQTTVQLKSGLIGSTRSTSLTLINEENGTGVTGNPRSGTMYLPSCTAASSLVADVSYNLDIKDTRVVFITDLSGSMNNKAFGTNTPRIDIVQNSLKDGVERVLDKLPSNRVEIGLVGFGGDQVPVADRFPYDGDENDDGMDSDNENIDTNSFTKVYWQDFTDNENILISEINKYDDIANRGTKTWQGMGAAEQMLYEIDDDNIRKIAVLMTDGEWADKDPSYEACLMKKRGVEVYTIGILSGSTDLQPLDSDCDGIESGGVYATRAEWQGTGFIDAGDGVVPPGGGRGGSSGGIGGTTDPNDPTDPTDPVIDPPFVDDDDEELPDPTDQSELLNILDDKSSEQTNRFAKLEKNLRYILSKVLDSPIIAKASACIYPLIDVSSIGEISCWSSGNPNSESGLDYAYNGTSLDDIEDAYEQIIDSIIGVTIQYTVETSDGVIQTSGLLSEGTGVDIPWPEGFECNQFAEQAIPVSVSFDTRRPSDSITISNVRFAHCAP